MQCKHIKVFGTVQGVGFRYYTAKIAKRYQIVGTVQNVDNYVEIYAQGEEEDLNAFIDAVVNGASPVSKVKDYTIDVLDTTNSWTKFKSI
ncbi:MULTISPECIES: acylphosphatase [Staphylococcus]|uniref:acylphosphatase n=1 Tax=Staphylococcus hsinchuensis TaxID=3051183 RepID=A0ABZ3EBI2_9STAP|nr:MULTISPECIES: acylphosphatase [unclassified Staphylococcus]